MAKYSSGLREEDLKNKVARDWFSDFDWTPIVGNIDFCVEDSEYNITYLWAEAKKGTSEDIYASFVQLIMTIGKAKTYSKCLPPAFLGAFDAEKIAFLPYHTVMAVFSQTDFNWTGGAASNHSTKEFKQLYAQVKETIEANSLMFEFLPKDEKRLRAFIKENFKPGLADFQQIEITRNNFVSIYYQWVEKVKPSITTDWEAAKKKGILDADFYLADVMSEDNKTLGEKLYVLLKTDYYEFARALDKDLGVGTAKFAGFRDDQKAHAAFWKVYKRPPKKEFRGYILGRRDLLVPTDVRQYTGAFFTPPQWVALSQEYLAKALGDDWQDEYYVWDCAAGTGNLLDGLTEPNRIWASTLLQADVDVIQQRISRDTAKLLPGNVFQFDFLNDGFDKLPANLRSILKDPEKRKKLVVYINPPYAEAADRKTSHGTGKNKKGIAGNNFADSKYKKIIGAACNELFTLFLYRAYEEFKPGYIGQFSTMKHLQATSCEDFRANFKATMEAAFLVPASSFDNVSGQFPIGFYVWNTLKAASFKEFTADVFDRTGVSLGQKTISNSDGLCHINQWFNLIRDDFGDDAIGYMTFRGLDFQNQNYIFITNNKEGLGADRGSWVNRNNLRDLAVYFAVRHVIKDNWLNDRDQFLFPADTWMADDSFRDDCLTWALFNNKVSSSRGPNNWIPFLSNEVGAGGSFASTFMTDYMAGKLRPPKTKNDEAIEQTKGIPYSSAPDKPIKFSHAALDVFDAGRELWRFYHRQRGAIVDASLNDIKAHFQGRNEKGHMNAKSGNDTYNALMADLRAALKVLAGQIKPKVYEHGFLKA